MTDLSVILTEVAEGQINHSSIDKGSIFWCWMVKTREIPSPHSQA